MKHLLFTISLIILSISLKGQQSNLIDFYPSTCDEHQDVERIRERISDIFIKNDTLFVTISVVANCGINIDQLSADAIYWNDTLRLSFEPIPIITDTLYEDEETIYHYSLSMEECDCCFEFMYLVKGVTNTSIPIKLNNKNISFHKEKYLTYPIQYKIHEGDTINYRDKYGLRQGRWFIENKDHQAFQDRIYRNDSLLAGTDYRYHQNKRLKSKTIWFSSKDYQYSEFDEGGHLIGQSLTIDIHTGITLPDSIDGKKAFVITEKMPEFPGGKEALNKYISSNLQYTSGNTDEFQNKVTVSFIIDKEGKVQNVNIISPKHLFKLTEFEKCVFKLINNMPKWKPGRQNGKRVPVKYVIPINTDPQ